MNVHAALIAFFARNLWRSLWEKIEGDMTLIDVDRDGVLTVDEIHAALQSVLGLSADPTERSLARFVFDFADLTGDGRITLADFQQFRDADAFHETLGPVAKRLL